MNLFMLFCDMETAIIKPLVRMIRLIGTIQSIKISFGSFRLTNQETKYSSKAIKAKLNARLIQKTTLVLFSYFSLNALYLIMYYLCLLKYDRPSKDVPVGALF